MGKLRSGGLLRPVPSTRQTGKNAKMLPKQQHFTQVVVIYFTVSEIFRIT